MLILCGCAYIASLFLLLRCCCGCMLRLRLLLRLTSYNGHHSLVILRHCLCTHAQFLRKLRLLDGLIRQEMNECRECLLTPVLAFSFICVHLYESPASVRIRQTTQAITEGEFASKEHFVSTDFTVGPAQLHEHMADRQHKLIHRIRCSHRVCDIQQRHDSLCVARSHRG